MSSRGQCFGCMIGTRRRLNFSIMANCIRHVTLSRWAVFRVRRKLGDGVGAAIRPCEGCESERFHSKNSSKLQEGSILAPKIHFPLTRSWLGNLQPFPLGIFRLWDNIRHQRQTAVLLFWTLSSLNTTLQSFKVYRLPSYPPSYIPT